MTEQATPLPAGLRDRFEAGMKIRFAEENSSYQVQAVSESGRYLICTKPFNLRRTVLYTIVDLELGIRGTDNYIFTHGYRTREECEEAAGLLETDKHCEVSYRNWVWIRLSDKQPDPRVAKLVAAMRATVAHAPSRNYNDHEPRTQEEVAAWAHRGPE